MPSLWHYEITAGIIFHCKKTEINLLNIFLIYTARTGCGQGKVLKRTREVKDKIIKLIRDGVGWGLTQRGWGGVRAKLYFTVWWRCSFLTPCHTLVAMVEA